MSYQHKKLRCQLNDQRGTKKQTKRRSEEGIQKRGQKDCTQIQGHLWEKREEWERIFHKMTNRGENVKGQL